MTPQFEPPILRGDSCTLVPLSHEHHDELVEAVKDGELWCLWYTFVPEPHCMKDNIATRLTMQADGNMLPFTVIDNQSEKAVGMTTPFIKHHIEQISVDVAEQLCRQITANLPEYFRLPECNERLRHL